MMKISYLWLKSILDTNKPPEKIAEMLTEAGLEVTTLTPFHFTPEGLFVGKIIESKPHPNADKLRVTKVNVGKEAPLTIVCGAPNATVNKKVIVAPVGTTLVLPNHQKLVIKKVSIRGQVSEGMLCAEDEIGLGNDHSSIVTLNTKYPEGTPVEKVWHTPVDTIFDIDLTPNRNDATHHFGVARDLAAKMGRVLEQPIVTPLIPCDSLPLQVSVKEKKGCPRYTGVVVKNIDVKPSPIWMQRCLKSIGIRPINNIIDITNFIMHDIGQPLHAFDYDQLQKKKISVKKLPAETSFTSLDGSVYTLKGDELMVCDPAGPLCMAGIIGGERARVTASTKTIFLESAYFDPVWIYRTAKQHSISTGASMRFSRGTDPTAPFLVLQKAVAMLQKYANGTIASMFVDEAVHNIAPTSIEMEYAYIQRLAGIELPPQKIEKIMTTLDIAVKKKTDEGFVAVVPPYRRDVKRPADVVEEILRIYGYNKVVKNGKKRDALLVLPMQPQPQTPKTSRLKRYLVAHGYNEIITNPITSRQHSTSKARAILLANPGGQMLDSLRTTLLFGGLEAIKNNLNRNQQTVKFFEIGKTYHEKEDSTFQETKKIGVWLTGYDQPASWAHHRRKMNVTDLQAIVKRLCNCAHLNFKVKTVAHDHYDLCFALVRDNTIYGHLGQVKALLTPSMEDPVFFAEINVEPLLQPRALPTYQAPSKYPAVTRDLSIAVPQTTRFGDIEHAISNANVPLLKGYDLMDHYQGQSLAKDQKSYTLRFTLQSHTSTLKEKNIAHAMEQLRRVFNEKIQATIRE